MVTPPLLFFVFQQGIEAGKRPVGSRRLLLAARLRLVVPFLFQVLRVLMVVAVDTQQLPVAAVGGIVVVVVILVMDRELTQSLARELAPAIRTDPREHPERPLPITLQPPLSVAPGLVDELLLFGLCARLLP